MWAQASGTLLLRPGSLQHPPAMQGLQCGWRAPRQGPCANGGIQDLPPAATVLPGASALRGGALQSARDPRTLRSLQRTKGKATLCPMPNPEGLHRPLLPPGVFTHLWSAQGHNPRSPNRQDPGPHSVTMCGGTCLSHLFSKLGDNH